MTVWEGYLWWMVAERRMDRYGVFFISDTPEPVPSSFVIEDYQSVDDYIAELDREVQQRMLEKSPAIIDESCFTPEYQSLYERYGRLWLERVDAPETRVLLDRGYLFHRVWQERHHEFAVLTACFWCLEPFIDWGLRREICSLDSKILDQFGHLQSTPPRVRLTFEPCSAPPEQIYYVWRRVYSLWQWVRGMHEPTNAADTNLLNQVRSWLDTTEQMISGFETPVRS